MEGRSRRDRLRVSHPLIVTRCFLQVRHVIGLRAEIGMVNIEGAIIDVDVNKVVIDITEMLLFVRFEGEMFILFALYIFDGEKANTFEDVNNSFHYTDLASKMVRDYGFLVCKWWSC